MCIQWRLEKLHSPAKQWQRQPEWSRRGAAVRERRRLRCVWCLLGMYIQQVLLFVTLLPHSRDAMPLLHSRDALLAGLLEAALITSWSWDTAAPAASAANLCVVLSLVAIPSAIFDYIVQHAPRHSAGLEWSAWECVASARQAAVVLVYFSQTVVLTCASAVTCAYVVYVLATGRRAMGAETARLAQRSMHRVFCVAMGVVLFVQGQGVMVLVPLTVSYVPSRVEPWMRIVVGCFMLYWHCAIVSTHLHLRTAV